MIDLICPTRSRPEMLRKMVESAKRTAMWPEKLHFRIGIDEDQRELYSGVYDPTCMTMYTVQDWGIVHTANMLVRDAMRRSNVNLFMIAPDDTRFTTPHWDKALVEHYERLESKIHVYCLQDSRDPQGTPHPIMTRQYVNAMGYFFPPIFMHWCVDVWTAEIAKANNCFTHLTEYELRHEKPSDRGIQDETYLRVRARGWHDRDQYVAKTCAYVLWEEKERLCKIIMQQQGLVEHLE